MTVFIERMIRAAKLDAALYEEVEHDSSALWQAIGVVVLSSLAAGIGNVNQGDKAIIWGIVTALAGWFIWAYITYFVGTKLLPESGTSATHGELLRTIGFSSSPGILRIFGVLPFIGTIFTVISSIWMFAAMIVAVRQALDYKSTGRTFLVVFIGWLIYVILIAILIFLT